MLDGEVGAGEVLEGGVLIDSGPGDFSLTEKIIHTFSPEFIFTVSRQIINKTKITILEAASPSF